jgi:hypothetical protein
MAGKIIVSSVQSDTDNSISFVANTGATIFSANLSHGIAGSFIADGTITAAKIADGAIVATEIADGAVTSSKLSSNISIANVTSTQSATFLGPIYEKANVVTTGGLTANITISTAESGVLVFTANSSANSTINFTGLSAMPVGNVASYVVVVPNGATARYISAIQIDGVGTTVKWAGGAPTTGTSANTDLYSFNIVKTSATPTYNVFAQVSNYY